MKFRKERLNSVILSQLGYVIERDLEFPEGTLVTLTGVEINRNLSEAIVKFSVFPSDKKENVERLLNHHRNEFQTKLFKKINIFSLPKIIFVFDEGIEKSSKIEKINLDNQVDKLKPSI